MAYRILRADPDFIVQGEDTKVENWELLGNYLAKGRRETLSSAWLGVSTLFYLNTKVFIEMIKYKRCIPTLFLFKNDFFTWIYNRNYLRY